MIMMPQGKISTSKSEFPVFRKYRCSNCGASGVKLWRQYQTFADCIELLCANCACTDQKKDVSKLDGEGRYEDEDLGGGQRCDSIGWLVPACPVIEKDGRFETYWGYTSVPQKDVDWWRALPNFPERHRW